MKVKIFKCSDAAYWYKDMVGQEFEVESELAYEDTWWRVRGEWGHGARLIEANDAAPVMPVQNKYSREVKPGVFIDVYDVLRAFVVTDPSLQHLVKKALAVGQRGHKGAGEDLQDILDSAQRAVEMHKEWNSL